METYKQYVGLKMQVGKAGGEKWKALSETVRFPAFFGYIRAKRFQVLISASSSVCVCVVLT